MIEALLKGKLSREQENMEDVLTSCVFGLLQYVHPSAGLAPFLSRARSVTVPGAVFAAAASIVEWECEFWPRWPERRGTICVPDCVITARGSDGARWQVLIEAKFRSGKSGGHEEASEHPTDQLAREWTCLAAQAARDSMSPILIYLTADVGMPQQALAESLTACHRHVPAGGPPAIYWLSWRDLHEVTASVAAGTPLGDLHALLGRMGLHYFSGFRRSPLPSIVPEPWPFKPTFEFCWASPPMADRFIWEFSP